MRRFGLALAIVPLILALSALPVAAAAGGTGHTVTITQHQHGVFTESNAVNPSNGHPVTLTVDGNAVQHITFFPASDEVWMTLTETGKFSGTDGDVTYTGHFTVWANFNMNERNSNSTFTFSIKASGSDGSVIVGHETAHFHHECEWHGDRLVRQDELHLRLRSSSVGISRTPHVPNGR